MSNYRPSACNTTDDTNASIKIVYVLRWSTDYLTAKPNPTNRIADFEQRIIFVGVLRQGRLFHVPVPPHKSNMTFFAGSGIYLIASPVYGMGTMPSDVQVVTQGVNPHDHAWTF